MDGEPQEQCYTRRLLTEENKTFINNMIKVMLEKQEDK